MTYRLSETQCFATVKWPVVSRGVRGDGEGHTFLGDLLGRVMLCFCWSKGEGQDFRKDNTPPKSQPTPPPPPPPKKKKKKKETAPSLTGLNFSREHMTGLTRCNRARMSHQSVNTKELRSDIVFFSRLSLRWSNKPEYSIAPEFHALERMADWSGVNSECSPFFCGTLAVNQKATTPSLPPSQPEVALDLPKSNAIAASGMCFAQTKCHVNVVLINFAEYGESWSFGGKLIRALSFVIFELPEMWSSPCSVCVRIRPRALWNKAGVRYSILARFGGAPD